MNMSFRTHCALFLIPGWGDVMGLPLEERIEKLRDPAVRDQLDELAHSEKAGVFRRLANWANYIIGDTFAPENEGLSWRDVGSIAAEQGKPPFDALLDLVIADDLRTVLWPKASDGDDASWPARVDVWNDPGAMVGGSDAGAHLDRMCGSNYPTSFLGDCLRKRKLVPMERAVQLMTEAPAELFGLARPGPGGRRAVRRPVRLRSRDGRLRAGHPGPRPARGQPPADRRRHRRGPGPGQRRRDHRRRQAHRQPARAPCSGRVGTR